MWTAATSRHQACVTLHTARLQVATKYTIRAIVCEASYPHVLMSFLEAFISVFTFKNIPKHFETQSLQLKCPKNIHRLAVWLEKIIKSSHQIARDFVDTFSADTDTDTADPRSSRGHSNTIVCRLLPEMFPPQPNCINNQLSKYLPSTDPLFCNLFFLL